MVGIGVAAGLGAFAASLIRRKQNQELAPAIEAALLAQGPLTLPALSEAIGFNGLRARGKVIFALADLIREEKIRTIDAPDGTPRRQRIDFIKYALNRSRVANSPQDGSHGPESHPTNRFGRLARGPSFASLRSPTPRGVGRPSVIPAEFPEQPQRQPAERRAHRTVGAEEVPLVGAQARSTLHGRAAHQLDRRDVQRLRDPLQGLDGDGPPGGLVAREGGRLAPDRARELFLAHARPLAGLADPGADRLSKCHQPRPVTPGRAPVSMIDMVRFVLSIWTRVANLPIERAVPEHQGDSRPDDMTRHPNAIRIRRLGRRRLPHAPMP